MAAVLPRESIERQSLVDKRRCCPSGERFALRFTNLQFLEDAREYKQDAEAMQVLIDQFQRDYEEELMVWEQQIQNILLTA